MKTVIIGGVAGGASAAARLRRLDEKAEIIIFEKGEFISFANCGLPYYIGGEITDESELTLQTPLSFKKRFNIDVRVFSEVTSIDAKNKTVNVKNLETLEVYSESYDNLIISTGAKPFVLPFAGAKGDNVFTLRNIPDTMKIKGYIEEHSVTSAVVIGGGYVGIEMAENLKNAGCDVSVVELSEHVIAPLDLDMAADVHNYMKKMGINLLLGTKVTDIVQKDGGVEVVTDKGSLITQMVIMSVGVIPETDIAKEAGVEVTRKGYIVVNDKMETNIPNIYAVGDSILVKDFVTGEDAAVPLAGPANKQGRIAADNICGGDSRYTGTQGSAILKIFEMTVAMSGLNETAAKQNNIDYDKTYIFSGSHAGYYPGSRSMSIKLLWSKKDYRIIGAQIVGYEGVDKRMDVLATSLRFGATVFDLAKLELCYAPPFSSAKDPVNMAGFVAENVVTGKLKQFFWDEVASLPRDGSVVLLDVRRANEVAKGKIEGFMNIPLDELRNRANEVPNGKPVYIHCHSGLRSYIACKMLSGLGYDTYNLAGGYRLYDSILKQK